MLLDVLRYLEYTVVVKFLKFENIHHTLKTAPDLPVAGHIHTLQVPGSFIFHTFPTHGAICQ